MIHEDEDVYITRRGEAIPKPQVVRCPFNLGDAQCALIKGHKDGHVHPEAITPNYPDRY